MPKAKWSKTFHSEPLYRRNPRVKDKLPPQPGRPLTRGECHPKAGLPNSARPCPWVGCRYHMLLNITRHGTIQARSADYIGDLKKYDTCALDIIDEHDMGLHSYAVAEKFNLSHTFIDMTVQACSQKIQRYLTRIKKRLL